MVESLRELWRNARRNPITLIGFALLLALVLIAVFAPLLAPYSPDYTNANNALLAPTRRYLFGTGVFGEDIFSRVLFGARLSMQVAVLSVAVATVVGGARTLFATRHSFAEVSPSELRARSHNVPIVAWTTNARPGVVSMRGTTTLLTLATPANAKRCVFARDEPGKAGVQFVTLATADCRAAAAPDAGWSPG